MKTGKFKKLLYEKKEYVVHLRALSKSLNHGLILKKCIE